MIKMNQILGFVLSLMGLVKTNYSPYAYHVLAYIKNTPNHDPYIIKPLLTRTYTIDNVLSHNNGYSDKIGFPYCNLGYDKI